MPELGLRATDGALGDVRVGVDVTAVTDVAKSVALFGDRYVERLFTKQEIASCGHGPGAAASLAARFAAKEAVLKVLEPHGARPQWRDIEVVRRSNGACRIRLHDRAASLAARRGTGRMSVSLSHESGIALAVVVAVCDRPAKKACPGAPETSPHDRSNQHPRSTSMSKTDELTQRIRGVLAEHGRLPVHVERLSDDDDLFQAGMTSHASVNVMLALEDAFDVEFPEAMLRKSTFSSISALRRALGALETMEVPA